MIQNILRSEQSIEPANEKMHVMALRATASVTKVDVKRKYVSVEEPVGSDIEPSSDEKEGCRC